MDEHTQLRSTTDGTDALEEAGVSVAAIVAVVLAFGSTYATVTALGGSLVAAVAAAIVGLGVLLAVPVGTTLVLRAVAAGLEDRPEESARRTPDVEPVRSGTREADD